MGRTAAGTVLITGAGRGLGREAVRTIASTGRADIVLGGRDRADTEAGAAELRERYGVNARALVIDVASLHSVREAASLFRSMVGRGETGPLSALMLNAGVQAQAAVDTTADGFERTFATNCLGHFLLANLLLDDVGEGGRVVWTVSGTHDPETFDGRLVGKAAEPDADALATTGRHGKPLPGGVRYTTSKLCALMYSYELDRRLRKAGRDVASIAYDPGYVPETGLTRSAPAFTQWLSKTGAFKWLFARLGGTVGDLAFSGEGLAKVGIDPQYASASGKYIQSSSGTLKEARSSRVSYDARRAAKLWRDSARLVDLGPAERPRSIGGET